MKRFILLIVIVGLGAGCATGSYGPGKYIQALNMVDLGDYQVAIDKSFTFVGSIPGMSLGDTAGPVIIKTRMAIVSYLFVDEAEGKKNIKEGILLSVAYLKDRDAYWISPGEIKGRHVIEKGRYSLDGVSMKYYCRRFSKVDPKLVKFMESRGYKINPNLKHGVSVIFRRIIDDYRILHMEYVKGIEDHKEISYQKVGEILKRADRLITLIKD